MAHPSTSQCAPLPSAPPTHAPPGRSSTRATTRPATASTAPRRSDLTSSSPRSSATSSSGPHSGAQHVACTSQPPSHNSNLPHRQPHRSRMAASRACIRHPYTRLPATHSGLAVLRAVLLATCAVLLATAVTTAVTAATRREPTLLGADQQQTTNEATLPT